MNLGIFHYAKKSNETYKIILIYDISYKTSMGAKLLHIRFSKIDSFIKIHDQIRYLVLFDYSFCDKIGDKIILLVIEKSSITGSAFETQMLSAWPIKCWGDFRIFQFTLVISWQKNLLTTQQKHLYIMQEMVSTYLNILSRAMICLFNSWDLNRFDIIF